MVILVRTKPNAKGDFPVVWLKNPTFTFGFHHDSTLSLTGFRPTITTKVIFS